MPRTRRQRAPEGPFEIRVHDLTHEGVGVARQADGKALFIPDALPGERVRYLRTQRRRDHDQGRLLEILEPAPERVTPRCPHFGYCGGCSLQHLAPEAQQALKQRWLLDSLTRIGGVQPEHVLLPLTGPIWHYRRRARLAVRHVVKKGRVLVGFRERDTPVVAVLDRCVVLDPAFGERLTELGALIGELSVHDQLPQIEVAAGDDGAAMVLRILRPLTEADRARLVRYAQENGIAIWLQPGGLDSIAPLLPDTPQPAYRLPSQAAEIRFAPNDFIQVNAEINRRMVDQALELLDLKPGERVLELFSGLGNFTLPLARRAAQVVAVEGDAGLVARARRNAELNGLHNIAHHVADLAAPAADAGWLAADYDAVLVDPPRTGAREVLPAVAARRPRRILYVSCHPGTLARDAGLLAREHGYRLRAAGIMDMFPHTSHVESMALFEAG
jgi:23S rRNA (uracil1939-C5)-methyltransferase